MADKDLFAPPTEEELQDDSPFAPPTPEELGEEAPKKSFLDRIKSIDAQTLEDTATGGGKGLSLGFSDEIAGALGATAEKVLPYYARLHGDNSQAMPTESWREIYELYRDAERKRGKEAQERSPIASTVGEIGGAVAPALLSGGTSIYGTLGKQSLKEGLKQGGKFGLLKALGGKVALGGAEGALAGGAYGAGEAEELENIPEEVKKGAQSGALFGSGIGLVAAVPELAGIAKAKIKGSAAELAKETPYLRQLKQSYEEGLEGKKVAPGETPVKKMSLEVDESVQGLSDKIINADRKFGEEIGSAIKQATDQGVTIQAGEPLVESADRLMAILENDSNIIGDKRFKNLADGLFKLKNEELSPEAVVRIRDDILKIAEELKDTPNLRNVAFEFQNSLNQQMQAQIPELAQKVERFKGFREIVPESLISKGQLNFSKWFGEMSGKEEKLAKSIKDIVRSLGETGKGKRIGIDALNQFEQKLLQNPETVKVLGYNSVDDFLREFQKAGDKQAMINEFLRVPFKESGSVNKLLGAAFLGRTPEARGLQAANVAGRAVKEVAPVIKGVKEVASRVTQPVAHVGRKLFEASDDALIDLGGRIKGVPGLNAIGDNLINSVKNKNESAKRAALYIILQKPEARAVMQNIDDEAENAH